MKNKLVLLGLILGIVLRNKIVLLSLIFGVVLMVSVNAYPSMLPRIEVSYSNSDLETRVKIPDGIETMLSDDTSPVKLDEEKTLSLSINFKRAKYTLRNGKTFGVLLVSSIPDDNNAWRSAGIREGDVIFGVNNKGSSISADHLAKICNENLWRTKTPNGCPIKYLRKVNGRYEVFDTILTVVP